MLADVPVVFLRIHAVWYVFVQGLSAFVDGYFRRDCEFGCVTR